MKNQILFREEFKEWLISNKICKPSSADSYASYLSGVNGQFDIDGLSMCERIEKYHNAGDPFKINQLIVDLVNELYREDICEITGRPQNTINNWRSALLQYTEFFYYFTVDAESVNLGEKEDDKSVEEMIKLINENADRVEKASEPKNIRTRKYKYPAKDLMKNFKFRIITQDRFYGEIFFPISFIKRLMYVNNEAEYFEKWLENQLNDILIYCENGTHRFNEISELSVHISKEKKEIYITVNNEQKLIYSPSSISNKLIPFASPNLKGVAIDHITSMKSILIDNLTLLPQLLLITSLLKSIAGDKATAKEYKAAGSILLKSEASKEINIEFLKTELELIKTLTKFQLMDKIENIKKGAK